MVAIDGAMVHTDGAWHEAKAGICQALRRIRAGTWDRTGTPDYCVGLEARPAFWQRRSAQTAAQDVESRRCDLVVLLGDGAPWIGDDARGYFGGPGKQVVESLDDDHAAEHVWAVAHALYPDDAAAAAAWAGPHLAALPDQGPSLQAALAALTPSDAAAAVVQWEGADCAYHAGRRDYPACRRPGLPVGSGTVERAGKVVLKQRVSQGGMRWTAAGAQAFATLRAWHRTGRWAAFLPAGR
ncbi:MAG: hypothetical protein K6V97_12300 [Actinomycetia bacterium]|nr:hypothetical protein [Actinomycetes bacterium]